MQELQLIGNAGKDAEIRESNNTKFATFSVGVTTRKKNGENVSEKTDWFECATDNLKVAAFIKKGVKVFVRGNFRLDQYFSDNLQKWVPTIKVYSQNIELLSPRKDDSTEQAPVVQSTPTPPLSGEAGNGGDDLPF